jgi:TRAP transporter 4TM/12TM fusion protein
MTLDGRESARRKTRNARIFARGSHAMESTRDGHGASFLWRNTSPATPLRVSGCQLFFYQIMRLKVMTEAKKDNVIFQSSEIDEKVAKTLDEYERSKRNLVGPLGKIVSVVAVVGALYHILALSVIATSVDVLRNMHLLMGFVLVPLVYPSSRKYFDRISPTDIVCIAVGFLVCGYVALQDNDFYMRAGVDPTGNDLIFGSLAILLILVLTKRIIGLPLVIVTLLFMLYARFAEYFPGIFIGKNFSFDYIVSYAFSPDGIFGITIGTSSTYVLLFIIFGAFLKTSGAGEFYTDFSFALAGRSRGGPAKVSVISSALFGTISGSGIANVVTTGCVTIPLMKKARFSSLYAGAIEAVSSTGGQIMPPVMGAGAFLMAEMIGVPYSEIMVAAAIPALLYFIAIYFVIDFQAGKNGLVGLPADQLPNLKKVVAARAHLTIPIFILIASMLLGYTAMRSAFLSIFSIVVVSAIRADTRMGLKKICSALEAGVIGCLEVIVACACAGIIMALVQLTGIGIKMSSLILMISGSNMFLALLLTAIVVIILSMGLPTTACYIISATVMGPSLVRMGISPLQAHMFIFYYACLSGITPPVALTAYPAAALAKADPVKVSLLAFRIGIVGFLVPFMFVFSPALFLKGDAIEVAFAAMMALVGTYFVASSTEGYFRSTLSMPTRLLFFAGGILLIHPGLLTDSIGAVCVVFGLILQRLVKQKQSSGGDIRP